MNDQVLQSAIRAHRAGNLQEAARLYAEVLRLNPRHFPALYAMGFLHYQAGHFDDAQRIVGDAIRLNPRSPEAFFTRGCALHRLGRHAEALTCFDQTLALNPSLVDAQSNRGLALMALNRNEQALQSLDLALAMDPSSAGTWNNHGCVLQNIGRFQDAVQSFDKAIALQSGFAEALINRGSAHASLKRFEAAASDFEQAVAIDPNRPFAQGGLVLHRLHACDWRHYTADRDKITDALRAGKPVIYPFANIAISQSMADQLQCARIFAAHDVPPSPHPLWRGERYRHEKIRVAYVSADFHAHATAALMAGVFEHHDRSRFETIAVSFGRDDKSEMRARVEAAFDRFIDARSRSDAEIALLMRQMEIDIAVDLKGYTLQNRAGIFAQRPAPLQVSYLGYPGTMGAPYMDYILADRMTIPEEHRAFYSEQIAYLPDSYQCNDSRRQMAARVPSRAELGLPEARFVFCCFNNSFKISPPIFDIWMRLLREIPGSVLWLLEDNVDATKNLCREAEACGIAGTRLVFAPRVSAADHLARHQRADLFLDTNPYGAHTTASDALWAGLPVVTVPGSSFAARVATSLLHATGMPELAVRSWNDYESLALHLARDSAVLSEMRARLGRNRETCSLFDTAKFTRNLEAAYVSMHQRQMRGEAPRSFAVSGEDMPFVAPPAPLPDAAIDAFSRACALAAQDRAEDSIALFGQALTIAPHFVEALVNRGAVLMSFKRYDEALTDFDAALALDPARFEAWNNRGNALSENGHYTEAIASYEKALALNPEAFEALLNRGSARLALHRTDEALADFDEALRVNPQNPDALNGRANALFELKRFEEAIADYEAVLARDYVPGILGFTRLQLCDWRHVAEDRRAISAAVSAGKRVINPFPNLALSSSPVEQKLCARIWAADKFPPSPVPLWRGDIYRHEKLRIAYLSADFRDHAVAHTMAGVFEHHDRARFDTFAVSWGAPDSGPMRRRLEQAFGQFWDVEQQNDLAVARRLRAMEIDIVVDLMGFTAEGRTGILAARPAPIQINYLGFPSTMGAAYFDYLIADRVIVPQDEQAHYAESVVYLPGAYMPADSSRRPSAPVSRPQCGLPETGFVFASFNNSYKFTPELFDIWMRLLKGVEGSVLWFSALHPGAQKNLGAEARKRGVNPERLIFAPYISSPADHLARLRHSDIFLDTLPYNAHATAMDALFACVPVLTCTGTTFAGRVGASLLRAVDLPELVTQSLEEYEAKAFMLAREPAALAAIRAKLAAHRETSPLFDTSHFTRNLETAYSTMWEKQRQQ